MPENDALKPLVTPWPNGGPTREDTRIAQRREAAREREAEKETENQTRVPKNSNG